MSSSRSARPPEAGEAYVTVASALRKWRPPTWLNEEPNPFEALGKLAGWASERGELLALLVATEQEREYLRRRLIAAHELRNTVIVERGRAVEQRNKAWVERDQFKRTADLLADEADLMAADCRAAEDEASRYRNVYTWLEKNNPAALHSCPFKLRP